jgi:hypothetical protein
MAHSCQPMSRNLQPSIELERDMYSPVPDVKEDKAHLVEDRSRLTVSYLTQPVCRSPFAKLPLTQARKAA